MSSAGNQAPVDRKMRLDKWLWAVRCFKTRTLAADACRGNRVKLNGATVKPSHAVRPGDMLSIQQNLLNRSLVVRDLTDKRIAAALVEDFLEDTTPAKEREAAAEKRANARLFSARRGAARPTKRDRRQIRAILEAEIGLPEEPGDSPE